MDKKESLSVELRTELPTTEQFWNLFMTTGWNRDYQLSPEDLIKAIANSWHTVSVYVHDKLVGFGRVNTDGIMHAMIYEVIVDPDYRRNGFGTRIVDTLVNKCLEANIHDIQLFCAPGYQSFYEKCGFKGRPSTAPGMDYCRRADGN
jgi:ribosomal protein S18 acetylase RimI-like enzyme